jgi:RNA polymerase sigma-70 factor (ECF subfamily)
VPDLLLAQIETLYRTRFDHFYRVARAILRDPDLAWDAVQDGFAGALRGRAGFRGDAPLEAWVWRSVVNAALRLQRPAPSSLPEGFEPAAPEPDDDVDVDLARLTERQRLVLFLRYYVDLDERSIGRILEIERGTVSATLHAAMTVLRRDLEVSQ